MRRSSMDQSSYALDWGTRVPPAHSTIPGSMRWQTSTSYSETPGRSREGTVPRWCGGGRTCLKANLVHPCHDMPNSYWATCIYHLRAITKREHRRVATTTSTSGTLYACIELLEREPTGVPVFTGPSHGRPPDHPPAITAWLKVYQRSCT